MEVSTKQYTLTGAGTEISNFNVLDTYKNYQVIGNAVAIGNYNISLTGTATLNDTFTLQWRGVLDITTNSATFAILGQTVTANQLLYDFDAICTYTGTTWDVLIDRSDTSVSVTTANIEDDAVTNAKLAEMATMTVKANITAGTANPSDVAIDTFFGEIAWRTLGNSGLTTGTNFIGTTDNVDLLFKANNYECGRIDLTYQNTSFGENALSSRTTGVDNTAFGGGSLASLTTGQLNTSVGLDSLNAVTTGGHNVAVGKDAGQMLVSGTGNTLIGYQTGDTLITGNSNTFIGEDADSISPSGFNMIALGSGAEADSNYQFALPDDVVNFKFRGVNYRLPASLPDGDATLHCDQYGILTWQ